MNGHTKTWEVRPDKDLIQKGRHEPKFGNHWCRLLISVVNAI